MLESWPLVGRQEELEFIQDALNKGGGGVVLAGAAGVGKTRLAQEALVQAEASGFPVYWTVATRSASSIPFGAMAHLLPVPTAGGDHLDLLRHAMDALNKLAMGGKLVLGVDDAHLLDEASAAFVHQAGITGQGFIVATVRTGEEPPDSIVSLWKDSVTQRVEVQTLAELEVEELVTTALGGVVNRATLFELNTASRGNPLLLRELLMSGLDSGALVRRGGIWRWDGPIAASVRLRELIESRIGGLELADRRVLEMLAFGEPLSLDTLDELADRAAVENVDQKGLLNISKEDRRLQVRLAHPLYGEVIRSSSPVTRARSVKESLAAALERLGARRSDDVLRIATWQLEAGSPRNADLFTRASNHAMNSLDYASAERFAGAAVEAGAGFEASFILGDALRSLSKAEEAEQLLSLLVEDAKDDSELRKASEVRAYNLFFGLDRSAEAHAVIADAKKRIKSSSELAKVWGQESVLALYSGRPAEAIAAAERVWGSPEASPSAILDSILGGAPALALAGKIQKALETWDLERSIEELIESEPGLRGQLMSVRFMVLWLAGRLHEAETLADNVYSLSLVRRSHDGMALMSAAQGQAALSRGKPRTAVARFRESAALLRERDRNRFLPWVLGGLAQASALIGDEIAAAGAIREAEEDCPRGVQIFAVEFSLSKAWVAALSGEMTLALDLARSAADSAARTQQYAMEARGLHAIARMGDPRSVVKRLSELAGQTDGNYAANYADHVEAMAKGDAKALDLSAERFHEMGATLLAAEAATEAARVHRAAGRNASALAAESRAKELGGYCEGARTPTLSRRQDRVPLTKREREVVTLAAQGLSSKEIADRLVLSIRTVDNHLHHSYSKLGIASREELIQIGPSLANE